MGVKPLYYSQVGNSLLFSNTLNTLRLHPGISDELNEAAIGDFLLFGSNFDLARTTFASIQRLPPAHSCTFSGRDLTVRRYWSLPLNRSIHYERTTDYIEHFKDVLAQAVSDRLRTDRVALSMSGGMDSTMVAATARNALSTGSGGADLRAFTFVYDHLIPDQERHFAGLAARSLGIPAEVIAVDDYKLFDRCPQFHYPEPADVAFEVFAVDTSQRIAAHSRVLLDGQGGDPSMSPCSAYFYEQLKRLRFGRALNYVRDSLGVHGRLPGFGIRSAIHETLNRVRWRQGYPGWLNPDWERRLNLPSRWKQIQFEGPHPPHRTRKKAYESLSSPLWPALFESDDPGFSGFAIEVRRPLFDVRLLSFLLAIPPAPCCQNKWLFREAMRGVLPEAVRLRPKAPLAGEPAHRFGRSPIDLWSAIVETAPEIAAYVTLGRVEALLRGAYLRPSSKCYDLLFRPLNLGGWLTQRNSTKRLKLPSSRSVG